MATNPFPFQINTAAQNNRPGPSNQQVRRTSNQILSGTADQPNRPPTATEFYDAYLRKSQNITVGTQTYTLTNKTHSALPLEFPVHDFKTTVRSDLDFSTGLSRHMYGLWQIRKAQNPGLTVEVYKDNVRRGIARKVIGVGRLLKVAKQAEALLELKAREWEEVLRLLDAERDALIQAGLRADVLTEGGEVGGNGRGDVGWERDERMFDV